MSKGLLEDMQAGDHDDKLDQYEYVVASLLSLNKISASDIAPIMDKFRVLAGNREFIALWEQEIDEAHEGDGVLADGKLEDELHPVY